MGSKVNIIILVGLPKSGKSLYAGHLKKLHGEECEIICRDKIRHALHLEDYIQNKETEVTIIEDVMVKHAVINHNKYVVIDACHMSVDRITRWHTIINDGNFKKMILEKYDISEINIEYHHISTPKEKCQLNCMGNETLIDACERMCRLDRIIPLMQFLVVKGYTKINIIIGQDSETVIKREYHTAQG